MSGARNGAECAENRRERNGALCGCQKKKLSGAGAEQEQEVVGAERRA